MLITLNFTHAYSCSDTIVQMNNSLHAYTNTITTYTC